MRFFRSGGQSAVEFALILPVFILLILGIVQLSLIFRTTLMVQYAAYQTARCAVAYEDDFKEEKARQGMSMNALMIRGANSLGITDFVDFKNLSVDSLNWMIENSKETQVDYEIEEESGLMRVTVTYEMPLTVPVANRFFGALQGRYKNLLYAFANRPYYLISATAYMEP